jgi:cation:H+ antiporter
MLIVVLLFILGLIIIIKGGDMFVDSAVWLAKITGMPNLLIGATVVSVATTLPELFVSTIASVKGVSDVAIGNAVGSTICNIGLILALSIVFMPGKINKISMRNKGLLMISATIIVVLMSLDRLMVFYEGLILIAILCLYVYMNIIEVKSARNKAHEEAAVEVAGSKTGKIAAAYISKFVFGAVFMVFGARLLVDNGVKIADFFRIPQAIISVTLIAIGTSLPELITTVTAIVKKHYDISVGNIIGSNILNVTMILGASTLTSSRGLQISSRAINMLNRSYDIPQTLYIDTPITLVFMLIVLVPALITGKLKRWQGVVLLMSYAAYLIFLGITI